MSDVILVSEADGIKTCETKALKGSAFETFWGAVPKFKRTRSFWRAFRRGEYWAVISYKDYDSEAWKKHPLLSKAKDSNLVPHALVEVGSVLIVRRHTDE